MKNNPILLLLVALAFFGCEPAKNNPTPNAIKNSKSEKHINIPGTRLFIIPPENFHTATNFTGLQKDASTAIQVYDLIGGNYYTNAATFNKESFEAKGAKVFEYKVLSVNGYPGKFIYMQGDNNTKECSLVFGDSTFSTMLMGLYPASDESTGEEIRQAFFSIVYDIKLKPDPWTGTFFTLDDSQTRFKFVRAASGTFMYSLDGIDNPGENQPAVIVTPLPADNTMTPSSISQMMVQSLERYGLINVQRQNISLAPVNGYDAHEVELTGEMKGKPILIYQLVVVQGDKSVTVQGMGTPSDTVLIPEFEALAHTVKFK